MEARGFGEDDGCTCTRCPRRGNGMRWGRGREPSIRGWAPPQRDCLFWAGAGIPVDVRVSQMVRSHQAARYWYPPHLPIPHQQGVPSTCLHEGRILLISPIRTESPDLPSRAHFLGGNPSSIIPAGIPSFSSSLSPFLVESGKRIGLVSSANTASRYRDSTPRSLSLLSLVFSLRLHLTSYSTG